MQGKEWLGRRVPGFALVSALLVPVGCSDGTGPDPDPPDVDAFVESLGSWSAFSPLADPSDEPEGAQSVVDEVVGEVTYRCTVQPYSITETPEQIVMYEPNASIMWVGNLIQGRSYRDGIGSFQELSIRQRSPLKVSIDLLTGDNAAIVDEPSLTSVQSAIGALIQRATDAGHRSGSSIHYEETLSHSAQQAALRLGLSARYMGFQAAATLNVARAADERTLVAHFVQKMFTISMELPQSPGDVFTEELTRALWDEQVAAGNVGPDNLPVYIAQITYGRTLTYSLTSNHSMARMQAAISASYNGLGSVSGYTEAELAETLSQQNLRVTAIGGEAQNVLALISSGNLKDYFTTGAPLMTAAKPLSYQLNYLGDNQPARVSETSQYTLRECAPRQPAGMFEFLPLQAAPAPVSSPYQVMTGDFNGDARGDLAWIHLTAGSAQVAVGFGQTDGTFDITPGTSHTAVPDGGWTGFVAHVGDFDGNGSDDLLFNRAEAGTNALNLAFSNGDGTFDYRDALVHGGTDWTGEWRARVGDLTGDGRADVAWTRLTSNQNSTVIARSNGDGFFTFSPTRSFSGGWADYSFDLADVTGDQRADLVWNTMVGTHNRTYVGRSEGDGTFTMGPYQDHQGVDWTHYALQLGDFDRDGRTDMVFTNVVGDPIRIYPGLGRSTGSFTWRALQTVTPPAGAGPLTAHMADFNGDGGLDLLWNEIGTDVNRSWPGLSAESAYFHFTDQYQDHSAADVAWTAFAEGVLVLDIDGDGRDDIVWNERAATNRIYVGLTRGVGSGGPM